MAGLRAVFDKPVALTPVFSQGPDLVNPSELEKGFNIGAAGLGSSLLGVAGVVGDAVGADEFAARQYAEAQAIAEEAARRNQLKTANFTDVHDLSSFGDWAAGAIGQGIPSSAMAFAGAGAGGLAAKLMGAGSKASMVAGGALGAFPQEMGEAAMNLHQDPEALANTSAMGRLGLSVAKGGVNAMLEGLPEATFLHGALNPTRIAKGVMPAISYAAQNAGKGMLAEGVTEGGQQLVGDITQHIANPNHAMIDPQGILNASAAGAVSGAPMSMVETVPTVVRSQFGIGGEGGEKKTVTDRIADAGYAGGKLLAKAVGASENVLERLTTPSYTEKARPFIQGQWSRDMSDQEILKADEAAATEYAAKVVTDKKVKEDSDLYKAAYNMLLAKKNQQPLNAHIDNLRNVAREAQEKAKRGWSSEGGFSELAKRTGIASEKRKGNAQSFVDDFGNNITPVDSQYFTGGEERTKTTQSVDPSKAATWQMPDKEGPIRPSGSRKQSAADKVMFDWQKNIAPQYKDSKFAKNDANDEGSEWARKAIAKWITDDFKGEFDVTDDDGKVIGTELRRFIPDGLIDELGSRPGEQLISIYKTLRDHANLSSDKELQVAKMAFHLDKRTKNDASSKAYVLESMTELGRKKAKERFGDLGAAVNQIQGGLRLLGRNGAVTKEQLAILEPYFGVKGARKVANTFIHARKQSLGGAVKGDPAFSNPVENLDGEEQHYDSDAADYESDLSSDSVSLGDTKFHGISKAGRPANMAYAGQRDALTAKATELQEKNQTRVQPIGVVDATHERLYGDKEAIDAEIDRLLFDLTQQDGLTGDDREKAVRALNKNFKVLREEAAHERDELEIPFEKIKSFRRENLDLYNKETKTKTKGALKTAQYGTLYFGSLADENYDDAMPVSSSALIGHANKEGASDHNATGGELFSKLVTGASALMNAPGMTGTIGYRESIDGPIIWLNKDNPKLPDNFLVMERRNGARLTMKDVNEERNKGSLIPQTLAELREGIRSMAAKLYKDDATRDRAKVLYTLANDKASSEAIKKAAADIGAKVDLDKGNATENFKRLFVAAEAYAGNKNYHKNASDKFDFAQLKELSAKGLEQLRDERREALANALNFKSPSQSAVRSIKAQLKAIDEELDYRTGDMAATTIDLSSPTHAKSKSDPVEKSKRVLGQTAVGSRRLAPGTDRVASENIDDPMSKVGSQLNQEAPSEPIQRQGDGTVAIDGSESPPSQKTRAAQLKRIIDGLTLRAEEIKTQLTKKYSLPLSNKLKELTAKISRYSKELNGLVLDVKSPDKNTRYTDAPKTVQAERQEGEFAKENKADLTSKGVRRVVTDDQGNQVLVEPHLDKDGKHPTRQAPSNSPISEPVTATRGIRRTGASSVKRSAEPVPGVATTPVEGQPVTFPESGDAIEAVAMARKGFRVGNLKGIQRTMVSTIVKELNKYGMGWLISSVDSIATMRELTAQEAAKASADGIDPVKLGAGKAIQTDEHKVITLNTKLWSEDFKTRNFKNRSDMIRWVIAHEASHIEDAGYRYSSSDPAYKVTQNADGSFSYDGAVAKELAALAKGQLQARLDNAPFGNTHYGTVEKQQAEVFAQASTIYFSGGEKWLKANAPVILETMEKHYGARGRRLLRGLQQSSSADTKTERATGSGVGKQNDSGGSRSTGSAKTGTGLGAEGRVTDVSETSDDKKFADQLIKDRSENLTKLNDGDVVWAVREAADETEGGKIIAVFKEHGKAQTVAEAYGANLEQNTVGELRKANAQSAETPSQQAAELTEEEQAKIREELKTSIGSKVVEFVKEILGPHKEKWSGEWTDKAIRIALNAQDAMGVAHHESLHELFSRLRSSGSDTVRQTLENVATNKAILGQIRRELAKHPGALKQLEPLFDPKADKESEAYKDAQEEAAAYLYQFWRAGKIKLGPKAETFFGKVAQMLKNVIGLISDAVRDELHAEQILKAFATGHIAKDPSVVLKAMEADAQLRQARVENGSKLWNAVSNNKFMNNAVYTAGGVLRDSKNKYFMQLADMMAPEMAKKASHRGVLPATAQERTKWLNKLDAIFADIDKDDLPAVTTALQNETNSPDKVVQGHVDAVRTYLNQMYHYMNDKNVMRWSDETHNWEKVPEYKTNYFPIVWNPEKILANRDKFFDLLMENHAKELSALAKKAMSERTAWENDKASDDPSGYRPGELKAAEQVKSPKQITAEDVANAIIDRILKANGDHEVGETTSDLGITPFAKAVNKRTLHFIDHSKFQEFKNEDLVSTLTNYTVQAVKRAEYTNVFGNDGEGAALLADKAWVHEFLNRPSDAAIGKLEDDLVEALKTWRKEAARAYREGEPIPMKPNLRTLAQTQLRGEVSEDEFNKRAAKANQMCEAPLRAIRAGEGTLGGDINHRLNNAMAVAAAYQSSRLMIYSLFTSWADPLGIIVNGGTLKDAYDGFVRGIKEVKLSLSNDRSTDEMALLAERLGIADASAHLETLGAHFDSMYTSGKLQKFNNALFKWNGMQGWNRGMRIQATAAAVGFIEKHLKNPKEHSKRYLEDELGLTGSGYLKGDKLDTSNPQVEQAIMRWVDGAILRPNAMQRPIVASDPHYRLIYQLKQFTYSFHQTILKRAYVEAKHGNYSPVIALVGTYVPMMIAADIVKEILAPGDEPDWMKSGGLASVVSHGVSRANLAGIPQMGFEALHNPVGLLGPTADQLAGLLMVPFSDRHSALGETVNAAPGAVVWNRMARQYTKE